jgi:hypothetical protein
MHLLAHSFTTVSLSVSWATVLPHWLTELYLVLITQQCVTRDSDATLTYLMVACSDHPSSHHSASHFVCAVYQVQAGSCWHRGCSNLPCSQVHSYCPHCFHVHHGVTCLYYLPICHLVRLFCNTREQSYCLYSNKTCSCHSSAKVVHVLLWQLTCSC